MTGRRGGIRQGLILSTAFAAMTISSAVQAQEAKPASIWTQETLTGDWGGARTNLKEKYGVEVTLNYIGETFGVFSGGLNRGTTYEHRIELSVDTDLSKYGWKGASTHFTIYQIANGGRNALDNVGSIADPSNINALRTTRLFTAWFQQGSPDSDPFSIRIGQLAADDEFLTSTTASGLINGTFGWAGIMAANIASGGPAYPLATPGVRVQFRANDNFLIRSAVFAGDPAGRPCNENPQACNRYGTTFSFDGGALFITEAQYAANQDKKSTGLAGAYKLGGWYATANYADQRFGVNGLGGIVSLADPTVVGPLNHRGDWGIYGVIDQMLWRNGEKAVSFFLRSGAAPSNRNLLSWYIDGGIGFKGLVRGRDDDVFTLGAAYAKISGDASGLDRDTLAFNGPPYPIRNHEFVLEASYIAQITPWWTIQPDIQYIVRPGGRVPDPSNPNATVKNAFLAGLRTTVKF